jgi:hypothetical protein
VPNIRPKSNIRWFFAAEYSVLAESENSCFGRTLCTMVSPLNSAAPLKTSGVAVSLRQPTKPTNPLFSLGDIRTWDVGRGSFPAFHRHIFLYYELCGCSLWVAKCTHFYLYAPSGWEMCSMRGGILSLAVPSVRPSLRCFWRTLWKMFLSHPVKDLEMQSRTDCSVSYTFIVNEAWVQTDVDGETQTFLKNLFSLVSFTFIVSHHAK